MNKLHELAAKHESSLVNRGDGGANLHKYEKLSREEIYRALDEKDGVIQQLRGSLRGTEEEKGVINRQKNEYATQVADLEHELTQ